MDSPGELSIRRAQRADLPAVLALFVQSGLDEKVLPIEQAENVFERMQCYPDYGLYVAEAQGRVVGTFALLIMDNLGHFGGCSGVLEDVAVAAEWQSRGVGRAMVAHAVGHCRERGCYKLALSSNQKRERAHAFYEGLGFERHGYSFRIDLD